MPKLLAYQESELRNDLIEVIPEAGSIVSKDYDEKLDVTRLVLSNGVKVTYKQTDFKNDRQILFSAYSKGSKPIE